MKDEEDQNMNKEKIHRTKTSKIQIKIKITNVDEEEYECVHNNDNKNNFDISSSFSPKSRKGQINNIKLKKDNDKNSNSENQINLFNFTNQLYLSEEHLNQKKIVKKNASQFNLPKLKKYLSVRDFNKYDDIKTSNSKQNSNLNDEKNINDEKRKSFNKASLISNEKSNAESIDKRHRKGFDAFFKLKEKQKIPPKILYIDKIFNLSNKNNKY